MNWPLPTCEPGDHSDPAAADRDNPSDQDCRQAAGIFRALGDASRLRILALLMQGELCVSDIAAAVDDNLSAVSQRLKLLRGERVVAYRRAGKHIYYRLADQHILDLVRNGLDHAREPAEQEGRGDPAEADAPPASGTSLHDANSASHPDSTTESMTR